MAFALADVSHIVGHHETTTPKSGPANPYVFSYQAGRAPGHVDRQHTEVSDGTGVIRGAFSYVDPKNQVRTVQYVADEHGFHPQLSHELEDSEAVKKAKEKHMKLYNRIAQEHAAGVHQPAVSKLNREFLSFFYIVFSCTLQHQSFSSKSFLIYLCYISFFV